MLPALQTDKYEYEWTAKLFWPLDRKGQTDVPKSVMAQIQLHVLWMWGMSREC